MDEDRLCHPASMTLRSVAAAGLRRLPPQARLRLLHGLGRFAPWEAGFDFTPPDLEPGEETGPPDFVGIGVQKAGTTWWYRLLAAHPGVSSRPGIHKERHFLSRFGTESFGPPEIEAYHGWFPRRPGTLAGEWTPDYFDFPWVPPLLAVAAPEARLLLMVRDPVERLRSGLAHQRRHRGSITGASVVDAVGRGFYHRALTQWSAHIDPEKLLVLQYERCTEDPASQLAAVLPLPRARRRLRPRRSAPSRGTDDRRQSRHRAGRPPASGRGLPARRGRSGETVCRARPRPVAELRPPPDPVILVAGGKLPSQPVVVVIVALILIGVSVPIVRRQGRIEGDPRLVKLLMIALLLHLLGSAATIFVDNHVYHGVADFTQYVHRGALISKNFRSFHFTTAGSGINTSLGDGSVSVAAGVVFSLIGVNELGAFFVFAWLSWLGSIFFYRAFCITFPEGGHRRYALMLFLLPSLLYWTSDVSKESVVMLALGVTTLGAARVFVRQPRGYPLIALGTAMGIATRPDEFAILFGAFTVSLVFRRQTSRPELRAVRRLGTILFLVVVLGVTALLTAKFLKSNASGAHSLSDILNKAHKNNSAARTRDHQCAVFLRSSALSARPLRSSFRSPAHHGAEPDAIHRGSGEQRYLRLDRHLAAQAPTGLSGRSGTTVRPHVRGLLRRLHLCLRRPGQFGTHHPRTDADVPLPSRSAGHSHVA